jgi:hypothetical protein
MSPPLFKKLKLMCKGSNGLIISWIWMLQQRVNVVIFLQLLTTWCYSLETNKYIFLCLYAEIYNFKINICSSTISELQPCMKLAVSYYLLWKFWVLLRYIFITRTPSIQKFMSHELWFEWVYGTYILFLQETW